MPMRTALPLRPLALCLALLFACSLAGAATITASVTDTTGQPVANTVVTLTDLEGKTVASARTNATGAAVFAGVAAGSYTLRAAPANRAPIEQTIRVAAADTPTVQLTAARIVGLGPVQVTAQRLKEAQLELSPKVGTTVYSIDEQFIDNLAVGADTPMNDVVLQFPGVAQDSKASGSLHVRGEHANVQYRINGVQLPEGITGFGQSVDTRFVNQIDFLTGALPAQFGQRTAGIVEIQTKEGNVDFGGSAGILGGGNDTVQPSFELLGSKGPFSYYVTGNYLTDSLGIENPTPSKQAIHDRTEQAKGFAYFSDIIDEQTRLGLMLGTYVGRFEIPNNPGQTPGFSLTGVSDIQTGFNALPSAELNDNQREVNNFAVISLQQTVGKLNYQASFYTQYSELHYTPDVAGDLIYTGVASNTLRSNSANGIQIDASYPVAETHTLRFGGTFTNQHTRSDNTVNVFQTDANGNQITTVPTAIVDNSSKNGNLIGLYLQDEWRAMAQLTINYGLRYDHVAAFTDEGQWSPRINALYELTPQTALHAGFSRYFTPPPQELASQSSINLYQGTTNAPSVPVSDAVRAERASYYDLGLSQKLSANVTVGIDGYYKQVTNLLDEGQFGSALILTPFNYANGFQEGVELSATYNDPTWSGYLNFAVSEARGNHIISGQSVFHPEELAYIAAHSIYLDHDQRYSLSGGLTYRFGASRLGADLVYGSGLRKTPAGAPPNSGTVPSYATLNLSLVHDWKGTPIGTVEGRLALINVFDKSYLIRDGTGVGVGAPQYGMLRTFLVGLSTTF
jgi:outer membrane receptor for ferrienterochelin and colicin